MNGVFTAVIAAGIILALFGLLQLEYLLAIFLIGGVGITFGRIK